MHCDKTTFSHMVVSAALTIVPWISSAAQSPRQKPDDRTPRVIVMADFSDSLPELAHLIAAVAQQRIPERVSPIRLHLVSNRDIDNTLVNEWTPKVPQDYGELAKLVRAVGAVVVTARGRRDSLDVVGIVAMARRQPADTMHFHASSPAAAVDSLVVRLLADERFRRGAK